jgi:septum formation protein
MSILPNRIYLASQSPRRRELLMQIGARFDLLLPRLRHDTEALEKIITGEPPADYVCRVARAKAALGLVLIRERKLVSHPVLAADTILNLNGKIVGKPRNAADARVILHHLSGRTHSVLTAVAVATEQDNEQRIEHVLSVSKVCFRSLGDDEILRYVNTGEPLDKAGAYGIQGRAAMFVASIQGSYSGIVGLPLCETMLLLQKFGITL